MTRRKALTLTAALILGPLVPAALTYPLWRPAAPAPNRALERALERAQAELEARTEVWEDHSTWETAWEVRTENFLVKTTHSRRLGLDVAQGLESMLGHFHNVLGTQFVPDEPFKVWIFPGLEAYNQFGDEHGEHHSSLLGSFHAGGHPEQPVAVMYHYNWSQLKMWATHSVLHQFLARAYPNARPTWLEEGLASYFELYWSPEWGKQQVREMRAGGRMIPLQQLIGASIDQYTDRPADRFVQLGMLFTYLLHYREDTRFVAEEGGTQSSAFADYIVALLRGAPVNGLPFHRYMSTDRQRLELEYAAFSFE